MEEVKNSKGKPIGVQISIFDLPGMEEKKDESVTVKATLNADKVKEAVEDIMNVVTKHKLTAYIDDDNICISLVDIITDNLTIK